MKYLDYLETKILLERLVIGLEEPILVKGLGELQAKIDSGNGGYNVIHGTDFHQQGDVLMFTTHDSFGHEHKISAKIIDDIEVNMGGGNIEKRPVIELDIKFAGEDYKKIPFSVSDRSTNTHPILISKGFVENELEALIDVGAKNISKDGVDVVYGEGFLNKVAKGAVTGAKVAKGLAKGGSSLAKGAWDATKGVASGAKGLVAGAAGAVAALGGAAVVKAISNCAKKLANSEAVGKIDQDNIRKQLTSLNWIEKYAKDENYVTENTLIPNWTQNDFKKHPIIPVVSFTGKKGGITGKFGGVKIKSIEKLINDWDKEIKQAKTAVEELKSTSTTQGQNKTEEQEEELYLHESLLILEADEQQENQDNKPVEQQSTDNTNTQETDATKESEFVKNFSRLKNFTLWFIPVSKSAESAKTNLLNKFKDDNNIDATLKNCFYKDVSKGSFNDIITSLQKILNETNMKMEGTYSGFFALCTGDYQNIEDAKNRTIDYYDKNLVLLDNVQYQEAQAKQKAAEQQKFNDTQNKLIKMGLQGLKQILDKVNSNNGLTPAEFDDFIKNHESYENFYILKTLASFRADKQKENIPEYTNNGQLQKDLIELFLSEINMNEILNSIKNDDNIKTWNDFVKFCTNLPMFNQQEEEQEEDAWVNDKLNYLRSKGII